VAVDGALMSTGEERQVVPFGKYKGRLVEELLGDRAYCEWLTAQSWFKERFQNVYMLIVNYGGQPEESPEHNAFQAIFLEHGTCLSLANLFGFPTRSELEAKLAHVSDKILDNDVMNPQVVSLGFEHRGWDVYFSTECGYEYRAVCEGERGSHGSWCCNKFKIDGQFTKKFYHWRKLRIFLELKPTLGDDYPNVLRQVLRYPREGCSSERRCVLVRSFSSAAVSWNQVQQIFASQGIALKQVSDLNSESSCACKECASSTGVPE